MAKLKADNKELLSLLAAERAVLAAVKAELAGAGALRDAMVNQARAEAVQRAKEEMRTEANASFKEGLSVAQGLIRESRGWK